MTPVGETPDTNRSPLLQVALGMPMKEIFKQIALEAEIFEALSTHAGDLG